MTTMRGLASWAVAAVAIAFSAATPSAAAAPLELVSTIPMPGVTGRIDHLSFDATHHPVYRWM